MRILMIVVSDADPSCRQGAKPSQMARFAPPFYLFQDEGIEIVLASRDGGAPWLRPERPPAEAMSAIMQRFKADRPARDALNDTLSYGQIDVADFDAAFCLGAPNAIWHDVGTDSLAAIIASFLQCGKPVAVTPAILDLAPFGAGEGLLIIGESVASPLLAARALLGVLRGEPRHPD